MRQIGVVLAVVLMVAGSVGLLTVPGGHSGTAPSGAGSVPAGPSNASTPAATSPARLNLLNATAPSTNPAEAMAQRALAAARAAGVRPNLIFPPRPSASPAQLEGARQSHHVTPLYPASPAPMGLAYYGLSSGPGGSVTASVLGTTSLLATIDFNSTGVQADDLFQSSPDSFGIQLNGVVTNVTLRGDDTYSFWTQNVVEYAPSADYLQLVTNVWNFSAPGANVTSTTIYQSPPVGSVVAPGVYVAVEPLGFPVSYPFDLSLFLNSSISEGRDKISFNVELVNGTGNTQPVYFPYDYVVFNSLAKVPTPLTVPANFTANGTAYNAIGLTDDFELDFGGPGGGSQATLFAADATLGLGYWNAAAGAYRAVPSAYSYGGETAETATGANIAWSNSSAGAPYPGISTYGTMTTGPSMLTGLWNASAPQGSYPVTLAVTPGNAFNLIVPSTGWSASFTISEESLMPELYTNVVYLIPGNYTLLTELSDYAPIVTQLNVTGPQTVTLVLAGNTAYGVYTPLWAFSNAEIAAISTSGTGTPGHPYLVENNQHATIGEAFGLYNDYVFPVYPAVFFVGTTATTEFYRPPSFATTTNPNATIPGLPAANDPQYWFWGVSNVAIVDAENISGWFGSATFYPITFDTFSVIFYESSHNLVAGNTFESESQGLLLFSGGNFFCPSISGGGASYCASAVNIGGGNNTVWGNYFLEVPAPPAAPGVGLVTEDVGLALEIAESQDLIYNNYVATPTTAWLLPLNLYSDYPEFFSDRFNITEQPAASTNYASGFPFVPLTGSIVHTAYQGGNFWWDYGLAVNEYNGAVNPYGTLPYDENATTYLYYLYYGTYYSSTYIYPGGDYVPLTPFSLSVVTIRERGPSPVLGWGAEVTQGASILDNFTTTAASYVIYLPSGSYAYTAYAPAGWSGPLTPTAFAVPTTGSSTVVIPYVRAYAITLAESGLANGLGWGATVYWSGTEVTSFATLNPRQVVSLPDGTFTVSAAAPIGWTGPSALSVWVDAIPKTVWVGFHVASGFESLTFSESGLPRGTAWTVTVNGTSPTTYVFNATETSTQSTIVFATVPGSYAYAISPIPGWVISPWSGSYVVTASSVIHLRFAVTTYTVAFTENGLAVGKVWGVRVDGRTYEQRVRATAVPLVISLANGTYTFSVVVPAGFSSTPSTGSISVVGASPTEESIAFSPK